MLAHRCCLLALAWIVWPWTVQTQTPVCERSGRLVDEAGAVIAFRPVTLLAIATSAEEKFEPGLPGSRVLGRALTRADGTFAMRLDSLPTALERKRCVFDLAIDEDEDRYARWVRLYEDVDLQAGAHDLGQRVAEKSVSLAAGIVVDDRGEVVDKSVVRVVHAQLPIGREQPLTYVPDENLRDDKGRFEIRASVMPEFVALQAFAADHLPSPVVWAKRGASDVRLEVTRYGSIDAHVLLDDVVARVPRAQLPIWVEVASAGDAEAAVRNSSDLVNGLDHHIGPLPPGRWTLRAGFERAHEALTLQVDVHAADARDVDIDLRGKIPVRYLDVVDEAGRPITTSVVLRQVPYEVNPVVSGEPASRFAIVEKSRFEGLLVLADGYRLEMVGRDEKSPRVVLGPGLPVIFHLPAGLKLPPKPWRLAFALDPIEAVVPNSGFTPGDVFSWSKVFAFDAPGDVTVTLPRSGRCDVWWMFVNGDERRRLPPRRVEIPAREALQRIEIEPDAKDYAAALEKLTVR